MGLWDGCSWNCWWDEQNRVKPLKKLLDFLVFSNVFVAVPVTGLVYQTFLILNVVVDYNLLILIYSATLFTYCFHRVYPLRFEYVGEESARYKWFQHNKLSFYVVMIMGLLVFLVKANYVFAQFKWFIPVGAIALGYTLAFLPFRGTYVRLRDIPYLKVFLIVGVVTYITTVLPILYGEFQQDLWTSNFILLIIGRALFLFGITLPFDIRDFEFDQQTNLKTIPGKIGVERARKLSLFLLLGFLIVESLRFLFYDFNLNVYVALLLSGFVAGAFILKAKPNGSEYFYSLGLEGTMIIQTALVVLALMLF